jgi:hypothetical protein
VSDRHNRNAATPELGLHGFLGWSAIGTGGQACHTVAAPGQQVGLGRDFQRLFNSKSWRARQFPAPTAGSPRHWHRHPATACKLAKLFYRLITKGEAYRRESTAAEEEKQRQRQLRALERKARELGRQVIPV